MRFLSLALLCATASGSSSGAGVSCTVQNNFGCSEWENDDRLKCTDLGKGQMPWVARPEVTDMYTLRTADTEDALSDPASYVPGSLMNLYVRVHHSKWKFRGLLVHAQATNGSLVGSWDLPHDALSEYWVPPECPNSLFHNSAERKPYTSILPFRAPEAGVGEITIKALIKKGPANDGFFYLPNKSLGELVLSEAPLQTVSYGLAGVGQSCSQYCANKGGCIDQEPKTLEQFEREIGIATSCRLPVVSSCQDVAPAFRDGICSYSGENCDRTTCDTKEEGVARFCKCQNPFLSGTGRSGPALALLLLPVALLFSMSSSSSSTSGSSSWSGRGMAVFALLAMLVCPASAHNWLHTPGRASQSASTTKPCQARKANDLHAQVGKGQEFTVKWATGHTNTNYLVVVPGSEYNQLAQSDFITKVLDYIEKAPEGNNYALEKPRYHDQRRGDASDFANNPLYKRIIYPNDTDYTTHRDAPSRILWEYNPDYLVNDRRVSYDSEEYPWIESAATFKHLEPLPSDADLINMTIPGRHGPGHYVVHWRWNGYYDCVDIDYRGDEQVEHVYGIMEGTQKIMTRLDHCQYEESTPITQCLEARNDAEHCQLQLSNSNNGVRRGMNVVPLRNPDTVLGFDNAPNGDVNIPWEHPTCGNSEWTKIVGSATTTAMDWSKWESISAHTANRTCVGSAELWEDTLTLRQAIARCSSDNCVGISWRSDASTPPRSDDERLLYRGCGVGTPEPILSGSAWGYTAKLNGGISHAASTHADVTVLKVNFLPTGSRYDSAITDTYFNDTGDLFGPKAGTNLQYGWNCPVYLRGSTVGGNYDLLSTYASSPYNNPSDSCEGFRHWKVSGLSNGAYRVTTHHHASHLGATSFDYRACTLNGWAVTTSRDQVGVDSFETVVEVVDGTLTLGAHGAEGGDRCDGVSAIDIVKFGDGLAGVWYPSLAHPRWQMDAGQVDHIGLVTAVRSQTGGCESAFLFGGDSCPNGQKASGLHLNPVTTGAIVRVSNVSCAEGQECPGEICDRINTAYVWTNRDVQDRRVHAVWCNKFGRYVTIQYPGAGRVMGEEFRASRIPQATSGDQMVCYGVQARIPDELNPEYRISYDPQDPIFHSTCFVRERVIDWLDNEPEPQPVTWRFNGQCVTCSRYQRNKLELDPEVQKWSSGFNRWEVLPESECRNCDVEPVPYLKPDQVVKWYESRTCRSTYNQCDKETMPTCTHQLVGDGHTAMGLQDCHEMIAANPLCQKDYVMYKRNTHQCFCYRTDECCGECTAAYDYWTDLYRVNPPTRVPAGATCEGGIVSIDETKSVCCPENCVHRDESGDSICGNWQCGNTNHLPLGGAMCCADGLVAPCSKYGPPCDPLL